MEPGTPSSGSYFLEAYQQGKTGMGQGLYMGDGLSHVSGYMGGVQRSMLYGLLSPQKVGKTTFCDNGFVLNPYKDAIEKGVPFHVEYMSFEIDALGKMFDWAAYFLHDDFEINEVHGIPLSSSLLRGRIQRTNGSTVLLTDKVEKLLHDVYHNRLVPLLGEYDAYGRRVKAGCVNLSTHATTTQAIRRHLLEVARQHGTLREHNGRPYHYVPHDPMAYQVVVLDHLRKLKPEPRQDQKSMMDEYVAMCVELRNLLGWTFVVVVHSNRGLSEVSRLKYFEEELYPTADDIKGSGNLAEEADHLISLFNPLDGKYGLKRHCGLEIRDALGNELFPGLRTIHLIESRHCLFPMHFPVIMNGAVKSFRRLPTDEEEKVTRKGRKAM